MPPFRTPRAAAATTAWTDLNPSPAWLLANLAKGHFRLNHPKEAVAAQEKALAVLREQNAQEGIIQRYEADLKRYRDAVK